jgi:catechol 2,3-dioxygenase-like lactoylglutathione lyase family enzyme
VGDHDAPESWLDRWREQEPLRLYLWSVAAAVLAGCVVAGWLTRELALAIAGPVSAALLIGGTAAARAQVYAPATVERLQTQWQQQLDEAVEEQHAASFGQGWEAGLDALEQAAEQTHRTPEQVAAETRPHVALQPATTAMAAQRPCQYVDDDGRRCVLPEHPVQFPHQLEAELDRPVEGQVGQE